MANYNPDQSGLAQNNPKLYRRPKRTKETKIQRIAREAKELKDKINAKVADALEDPRKYVDNYVVSAAESDDEGRRKKGLMLIKWLELKEKNGDSLNFLNGEY